MKFLRLGSKGKEIPAIVDDENNYRDLSSLIDDFKPSTLNFEILKKTFFLEYVFSQISSILP